MIKNRHLLISTFVIMLATLAIISCKKRDPVTPDDQNVSSQVITALKDWHAKTTGVSYNTSKVTQSTDVMKKNALQPLWDKAKYKILASGERVIVVPAPKYALDNKDVQFSRFFVFTEINAKIENGNIVELYSKNGSLSKTIDIVTEFKESSISGFSGAVITYDLNYNYSGSNFYINGKKNTSATYVVKQQKVPVVAANKTKRIALTALNDEGGGGSGGTSDCTDYYWVVTYSDGSTDSTFLYRSCTGGSDPGNGTGPGGGGTPPPPPPATNNPCNEKASVSNQQSDCNLASYKSTILSDVASNNREYGVEMNLTSTTGNNFIGNATVRSGASDSFSPIFTWNSTQGYTIGTIHGHPGGSAPSPDDIVWAYGNLSDPQLTNAGYGDVAIYKARYSLTVVTASATYVVTIKDWGKLYAHKAVFDSDPVAFDQDYANLGGVHNSSEYALLSKFGDAINLYKAPAGSNVFQPLQINTNDQVGNVPCP